jgi:hypothetical protein
MQSATDECAAILIASDNGSNFEKTDAAMLALSSIASDSASNFERTDAARQLD